MHDNFHDPESRFPQTRFDESIRHEYRYKRLPYRFVRYGSLLYLLAYGLILPASLGLFLAGFALFDQAAINFGVLIVAAVMLIGLSLLLIGLGSILFLFTPESDQQHQVIRYMFFHGAGVAVSTVGKWLNLGNTTGLINSLLTSFGVYALLQFFKLVAMEPPGAPGRAKPHALRRDRSCQIDRANRDPIPTPCGDVRMASPSMAHSFATA